MVRRYGLMPVAPSILQTFRVFDDLLNMPRTRTSGTAVDAYETEKEFVVKMDVPGWRKEDLKIRVEDGSLYITGNREEVKEVEEKSYYRRERYAEQIHEVIPIPAPVDPGQTRARLDNGVLEVVVPKTELQEKGVQIDID